MPMPAMFEAAARFLRTQPGFVLGSGAIAGFAAAAANLVGLGTVYPRLQEQLTAIEPLAADPQAAEQAVLAQALVQLLSSAAAMFVLVALLSLPVYAVVNAMLIVGMGRAVHGETTSVGQAWGAVLGRIPLLLGQVLMIVALAAVCSSPVVVALSMAGRDPVVGLGLAILLTPLCLAALLVVLPRLVLAPVCLVLEDLGVSESFVRARLLVRGQSLRVLGITLAGVLITRLVGAIVGLPFDLLAGAEPLSTQGVFMTSLGRIVGTAVSFTLLSAVITLVYVDLRIRREGIRPL